MTEKTKTRLNWAGRAISGLSVLPFIPSAYFKIMPTPEMLEQMGKIGIPTTLLPLLAFLEISCVVLYLIPQTAVLGAILFTGYMGGTIITHLRVGEVPALQVAIGLAIWGGLYLRERRLWDLLPLRKNP